MLKDLYSEEESSGLYDEDNDDDGDLYSDSRYIKNINHHGFAQGGAAKGGKKSRRDKF
jgi:hypothetical protein